MSTSPLGQLRRDTAFVGNLSRSRRSLRLFLKVRGFLRHLGLRDSDRKPQTCLIRVKAMINQYFVGSVTRKLRVASVEGLFRTRKGGRAALLFTASVASFVPVKHRAGQRNTRARPSARGSPSANNSSSLRTLARAPRHLPAPCSRSSTASGTLSVGKRPRPPQKRPRGTSPPPKTCRAYERSAISSDP